MKAYALYSKSRNTKQERWNSIIDLEPVDVFFTSRQATEEKRKLKKNSNGLTKYLVIPEKI